MCVPLTTGCQKIPEINNVFEAISYDDSTPGTNSIMIGGLHNQCPI